MNKRHLILASSVAAILAAPAAFATCPKPALQFGGDDTGIITWQPNRLDSPLDPNHGRLAVHVLRQDGDDYVYAISNCSGIEGQLVGAVRNLSFDFENESVEPAVHIGAGSPRYSVEIDSDGDTVSDTTAFLAAFHCRADLPENPGWSRADFTGRTLAGCSIFVGAEQFTSDGAKSAWKLFAEAHPTYKVTQAYLLIDEEGTSFVDRLAFHNKMYVQAGTGTAAIKTCGTESSC